jgi:hypothetical protein
MSSRRISPHYTPVAPQTLHIQGQERERRTRLADQLKTKRYGIAGFEPAPDARVDLEVELTYGPPAPNHDSCTEISLITHPYAQPNSAGPKLF